MAGNYVLIGCTTNTINKLNTLLRQGIGQARLDNAIQHPAGGAIPGGVGNYLGWTTASRGVLDRCFDNGAVVANRAQLPPHLYYVIGGANPNMAGIDDVLEESQLVRTANFNLIALNPIALNDWNAGRHIDSLRQQVTAGNVSLEIYYFNGLEVQ